MQNAMLLKRSSVQSTIIIQAKACFFQKRDLSFCLEVFKKFHSIISSFFGNSRSLQWIQFRWWCNLKRNSTIATIATAAVITVISILYSSSSIPGISNWIIVTTSNSDLISSSSSFRINQPSFFFKHSKATAISATIVIIIWITWSFSS